MKLAIYTFTYRKEAALVRPLVDRLKAARGGIPLEDITIVVLNDPRAPLPADTISTLELTENVRVYNTATDRRGNLRGCEFVTEASQLMATLVPDADFIIKIDPDTIPLSLERLIQPLVDDPSLTANLIPANRKKTFAMGYCYAYSMSGMRDLAAACLEVNAPTFNMAVEYMAAALHDSAMIPYNFPAREDMFLSVMAARLGKVIYAMRATAITEGDTRDMATVRANNDAVLLHGAERWGRERMVAVGEVFLKAGAGIQREKGAAPIYVLGTGTCFSGTTYVAKLLSHQPGVYATHEIYGGLSREPMRAYAPYLSRLAYRNEALVCADVSASHVEHLRALLALARENKDDLRVFGIIRDPAALLESFNRMMIADGTDYFTNSGKRTEWSRVYPHYDDEPDSDARVLRYIKFVHDELRALASEFPDNVFVFQLEELNTEAGVAELFDKLGIPKTGRRFEAVGLPVNSKTLLVEEAEEPLPPLVPQVLPAWKVKAVAEINGLSPTIMAALAAIPDPVARAKASLAWTDGNEVRRTDPTLNAMAAQLGLAAAVVDQMFIDAQNL